MQDCPHEYPGRRESSNYLIRPVGIMVPQQLVFATPLRQVMDTDRAEGIILDKAIGRFASISP
jgi:hypothetical protein